MFRSFTCNNYLFTPILLVIGYHFQCISVECGGLRVLLIRFYHPQELGGKILSLLPHYSV